MYFINMLYVLQFYKYICISACLITWSNIVVLHQCVAWMFFCIALQFLWLKGRWSWQTKLSTKHKLVKLWVHISSFRRFSGPGLHLLRSKFYPAFILFRIFHNWREDVSELMEVNTLVSKKEQSCIGWILILSLDWKNHQHA